MATSNTALLQLLTAVYKTPLTDKQGNMTLPWQLFLQGIVNATGSGGSGNTSISNSIAVGAGDQWSQQIQDIREQLRYVMARTSQAAGIAALETQQAANSVTTAADVLDLINLSELSIILDINMYLAAKPDSAANLDIYVCWNDVQGGSSTPNANITSSSSNTECVIAGPPATSGATQDVQFMTIFNSDVIGANVAIYNNSSGVQIDIIDNVYLQPGYTLIFDEYGFKVMNAAGVPLR